MMFNYLAEKESAFFENWNNSQKKFLGWEYWLGDLFNYINALTVPFSKNSLDASHFSPYLNNLKKDAEMLFCPIALYMEAFREFGIIGGFFVGTLTQLFVPFFYASIALDIALQVTTIALGLITRSIATLAWMAYYQSYIAEKNDINAPILPLAYNDTLNPSL